MAPEQRTTTSADGTRIAFGVSGAGPALVCVGGALQRRTIDPSTARLAELLSPGAEAVERFLGDAGVPPEEIAGMRAAPIWPAFEGVAHTLAYDGTIMGDGTVPAERAAKVTAPVLVLDGGASPEWAANAAQAVAAVVPDARRRTLEGQTHVVAPDALAPAPEEFSAGSGR